jgi:hypothetical protein
LFYFRAEIDPLACMGNGAAGVVFFLPKDNARSLPFEGLQDSKNKKGLQIGFHVACSDSEPTQHIMCDGVLYEVESDSPSSASTTPPCPDTGINSVLRLNNLSGLGSGVDHSMSQLTCLKETQEAPQGFPTK